MTTAQHQTTDQTTADLYLRLSDFRHDDEGSFPAREARLRAEAARLGWAVHRVVIENDVKPDGGRKPASAWKRVRTGRTTENGRPVYRVERDGWRGVIRDLETGAATAVLAEDLDRTCRDMADLLDLLDAVKACGGQARSLSGSLTLTDGGTSSERTTAKILVSVAEKSSDDTSRRVRDGRERWAGQSYGGGRRPYGYRVTADTEMYHRTLAVVEAEAAVIRDAATGILDRGVSLKAAAAGLRDRGVPTVTGAPWTASTLRDVLSKQALAGLTDDAGRVVIPAVLDQDQADRLRDLFASRANPGTSNAPRWLLSGTATCGVCQGPVKCTGTSNRRAYTCTAHGHVRRAAVATDEHAAARVLALIERDAAGLLRPAPRKGTDAAGLRAELRKLADRKAALARMFAADGDEAALTSALKVIRDKTAEVEARLADSDQPDPLPEFRGGADPLTVWDSLGIARQRAVVRLLYTVTILPATHKGAGFDPDSVRLTRRVSPVL